MKRVSECLRNTSEYEKLALEKCSKACGNSEGDIQYKYHCMMDSTHKDLFEMCAIPKYLFGNELFSFFAFSLIFILFQNYLYILLYAHCENIDTVQNTLF